MPARLAALLALFLMAIAPGYAQKSATEVVNEIGIDQKLNAQLPLGLRFRDESGREIELGRYFKDRPVILILAYYRCPMLCDLVMNGTVKALRTIPFDIGKDFDIVTVSIDPEETPELAAAKKASYVADYKRPGAENGWHFLTGEADAIEQLARTVGFRYIYDAEKNQYAHGGGIMVVTPTGRISKYFYGVEYAPPDLRLGLVEASGNNIGTLVDEVKLLCYQYDPVTGKYGFAIMQSLRLGGILTVAILIGFIVMSIRRDRRKNAGVGVARG